MYRVQRPHSGDQISAIWQVQTRPGPHRQNRTHPEFPERGQREETAPVPSKPKAHGPIAGRSVSRPVGSARINLRTRAINKQPRPEVAPRRDPDNPGSLDECSRTACDCSGTPRGPLEDHSATLGSRRLLDGHKGCADVGRKSSERREEFTGETWPRASRW